MSGSSSAVRSWIDRRVHPLILGAGVLGLLASATTPATAAPIRRHALVHARANETVEEFFTRALAQHLRPVVIPNSVHGLRADADGLLPDTSFVRYLTWRRSLKPARFDRVHPRIGPMLARNHLVRTAVVHPPFVDPTRPPQVGGQDITPPGPQVPEPGSAAIALVMIGSATLARRWAGKQRMADRD